MNVIVTVPADVSNAPNCHSPAANPGSFPIVNPAASNPGVAAPAPEYRLPEDITT